jgi:S1-C subfamily serine protease
MIVMKKVTAAALAVALACGVLIGLNWQRIAIVAEAEDPTATVAKSSLPDENRHAAGSEGTAPDRPSQVLYADDLLELLADATEKLIEKKQTRNSSDLRQELDREQISLTLVKPATTELSTQELYRRAAESLFLVAGLTRPTAEETEWETAFSTAFVVHADGILSTSAHVFDHDDQDDAVVVMDFRGQVFPVVEILATDRLADTCLFRIGTRGLKPFPLGQNADPGTPICVIGHPGDSLFFFSAGHIANYERDDEGAFWLNVTADFGQGSSGGPVMDRAGNIVGQVSRTYTLYAGSETTTRRRRRPRKVRQVDELLPVDEPLHGSSTGNSRSRPLADPQMVFKSCTPVSAIKKLTHE